MVIFTGNNGSLTLATGSAPVLVPANAAFTTSSAVQLNTSGTSALAFQPGSSITLPDGTQGNDQIVLYGSGTVTKPGGTATAFVSGSGAVSLPSGSLIQFSSTSAMDGIAFATGGTGGAIPLTLSASDTLTAPVALGNATGTLKIIVPAANFGTTGIAANGLILSPSSIVLEGNQVYGYNSSSVTIDSTLQTEVANDATSNGGAWSPQISNILGTNSALAPLTTAEYGAEIVNAGGDLMLASTWDFSALSSAGIVGDLTLRASGNIILEGSNATSSMGASLTDGFSSNPNSPWEAPLLTTPSWSFNLTAGADLTAADAQQVKGNGSLLVGANGPTKTIDQAAVASGTQGTSASTQSILTAYYQTIRTGTGNINISTGGDVQLMNALANIYTAGRQLTSTQATSALSFDGITFNDFSLPQLTIPANSAPLGNAPTRAPITLNTVRVAAT